MREGKQRDGDFPSNQNGEVVTSNQSQEVWSTFPASLILDVDDEMEDRHIPSFETHEENDAGICIKCKLDSADNQICMGDVGAGEKSQDIWEPISSYIDENGKLIIL